MNARCKDGTADLRGGGATDLHVHSTCSDGTYTPVQLVDYAISKGLSAFALTDHDCVDGLDEALDHVSKLREQYRNNGDPDAADAVPEVIPGVELSTEYQGRDIHIVGLFIDYKNTDFQEYLRKFIESRDLRNQKMCALLQQAGMDISYEKLMEKFPGSVITRAHYAKYMLEHGYIKSMKEAFERYIGDRCPYYIPREKVTPAEAVELILQADGVPILAHPVLYGLGNAALDTLVAELKAIGLMGIEALYSTYEASDVRQIRSLAKKYNLLISGGSDFHGDNKPGLDLGTGYGHHGCGLPVPLSVVDDLHGATKKILFTDLDGTLLRDDSTVSPAVRDALDHMTAAGHRLILSSGRPLPSILEVREKEHISYPGMLILADNGSLVYDCDAGKPLLEHRIPQEDIRYISAKAEAIGLHLHSYTEREIVCHGMNSELDFYTRRIHMPLKYVDNIADTLPEGCYKMLCIHLTDRSVLERFRAELAPYCEGRIRMSFSNNCYLEILPITAGKGPSLRFAADYLHIPITHTFAAGDAENDISMIQAAGTGIAMANADEAVKKAARIVTKKSNNEDGLLEIIDQYF